MPNHEPRFVSIGQRDLMHRAELANLCKQGERVVPVVRSPRLERLLVVVIAPTLTREACFVDEAA
jgi:hypothetical protein